MKGSWVYPRNRMMKPVLLKWLRALMTYFGSFYDRFFLVSFPYRIFMTLNIHKTFSMNNINK